MTEQEQSLTYHSLYRHVQSIVPQYQGKDYPSIYSSNQQPHLPSILSRSRQKKSHEKSLKKGISRVSKSKPDLKAKQEQFYDKEILKMKSRSKGTLLNFNIQEVLDSKYHMEKQKDQILEKSPQKFTEMQTGRVDQSVQGSNSKSFISEYRIVTYVPQGYKGQQTNEVFSQQENFNSQNVQNWNKQNNLNDSNLRKGNHNKNDSEEIHVINPNDEHVLQLDTWRTSEYYDPYYSNNYRNQPNQIDQNPQEKPYSSFQYKYSVPLALQIHEKNEPGTDVEQLKTKIKHLEHQIVEIQRQKTLLSKENQTLKSENSQLAQLHQSKSNIITQLQQNVNHLLEQIKQQESQIQQYQQTLNQFNTKTQTFTLPHLPQYQKFQKNISRQVEELQLLNAKISKQISQKNLLITDLNKKNREISQKATDLEKEIRNKQQRIESFEKKISTKDQKIVLLSQEINRLTSTANQRTKQNKSQYNTLPMDRAEGQKVQKGEFEAITNKYDKLLRDFNHLQKKHLFMKDQLEHLKYLQTNGSSSTLTNRQVPKDQNPPNSNQLIDQYEQMVQQLQDRLEISERTLTQLQEEYSNLKQNFRALEELYIKQQNESDQIQHQTNRVKIENNNLKTEMISLDQVFNAKSLAWNKQEESPKLLEKEEIIIALKRQLNLLDRTTLQLSDQVKILQRQRQQINQKYIQEVEMNTQLSRRHKEDLTLYALQVDKQQKEKTALIVLKYQNLISKLNQEILSKKQQIMNLQDDREFQIGKLQERYKKEIERVRNEKKECLDCFQRNRNDKQNSILHTKQPNNYTSLPYSRPDRLNYESINRKDETFIMNLQQDFKFLEQKYKNLAIENQRLQDDLRDNARKLVHLEKDLQFYKDYKDTSAKEKLQLCQQIQRINGLIFQLKKANCSFEDQKHLINNQFDQMNDKYIIAMKQNQSIIDEINILEKNINDKNILLQNYEHDIRSLRIALLEEQQLTQKKIIQFNQLREQKENHKSKEEYYKMLYQKTLKELEIQLQQKSLLLLNKQQTVPNPSPVKQKSPQKNYILIQQKNDSIPIQEKKDRETELYRLQIYKDLNKLLNMTSQTYTLEQIVQKNQQEYLRKLYNAIKEDHDKGLEFKQLIVDIEESFKKEKIHIKQDYDLVYEKYLKYKSMCQAMEKDIEKFKLQFKKRDQNFASINL